MDILFNARKMTDGRTGVEVIVHERAGRACLSIHSIKVGLDESFWPHLITAEGPVALRTARQPVSPTGLFAPYEIVRLHGGTIEFSTADDGGLLVTCVFHS